MAKLEEGETHCLDLIYCGSIKGISCSCKVLTVNLMFASVGPRKDKGKPEGSRETKDTPTQQQKEDEKEKEEPHLPSRVVEDQSVACTPPVSPSEEEDPLVAASKQPWEEDARVGKMEKTFSVLAIERILGLLVATLPEDLSVRSPTTCHCCF